MTCPSTFRVKGPPSLRRGDVVRPAVEPGPMTADRTEAPDGVVTYLAVAAMSAAVTWGTIRIFDAPLPDDDEPVPAGAMGGLLVVCVVVAVVALWAIFILDASGIT